MLSLQGLKLLSNPCNGCCQVRDHLWHQKLAILASSNVVAIFMSQCSACPATHVQVQQAHAAGSIEMRLVHMGFVTLLQSGLLS